MNPNKTSAQTGIRRILHNSVILSALCRVWQFLSDDRTTTWLFRLSALLFFATALLQLLFSFTWSQAKPWLTGAAFYACLFVLVRLAWFKGNEYRANAERTEASKTIANIKIESQ